MSDKYTMDENDIFNPDEMACSIDMGGILMENPPKELLDKLMGKTIKECEIIIEEFIHPKEKLVIKWSRKIGYDTTNDNR